MLTRHSNPAFTQPEAADKDTLMLHRGANDFYGGASPIAIHSEFGVTIVADPYCISMILDDGAEIHVNEKGRKSLSTLGERIGDLCRLAEQLGAGTVEGVTGWLLDPDHDRAIVN